MTNHNEHDTTPHIADYAWSMSSNGNPNDDGNVTDELDNLEWVAQSGFFPVRIYSELEIGLAKAGYKWMYEHVQQEDMSLDKMQELLAFHRTQSGILDMAIATALDEIIKNAIAEQ